MILALVAGLLVAEVDALPMPNVSDPARPGDRVTWDDALPFVWLEPHAGCLDAAGRLPVTLVAVNRSDKPQSVDWAAVAAGLRLRAVGPGRVRPAAVPPTLRAGYLPAWGVSHVTLDLKTCFDLTGGSVYELSAARPLPDGRLHLAQPVWFLVEDAAALDAAVAGVPAGPARDTARALLACNPSFASAAAGPKGSGRGYASITPAAPLPAERTGFRWDAGQKRAAETWEAGMARLLTADAGPAEARAVDAILDRTLAVSGGLRRPPGHPFSRLLALLTKRPAGERERADLKLVRCHDRAIAGHALLRLAEATGDAAPGATPGAAAVEALLAVADGDDPELADEALGRVAPHLPPAVAAAVLRRRLADPEPRRVLQAAILTCYHDGDWSGFPLLLRFARSPDPKLRLDAIAQLVDCRFAGRAADALPVLLAEIEKPLTDEHLHRAIESVATYPGEKTEAVLAAHLTHPNEFVRGRAKLGLERLKRDRGGK